MGAVQTPFDGEGVGYGSPHAAQTILLLHGRQQYQIGLYFPSASANGVAWLYHFSLTLLLALIRRAGNVEASDA
jgi:hypothetical protein